MRARRTWVGGALLLGLLIAACDDGGGGGLSSESFPDLEAEPTEIVLSAVPIGETTGKTVALWNRGDARLQVASVHIWSDVNNVEFSVSVARCVGSGGDAGVGAPVETPFIVGRDECVLATLVYAPQDEGTDTDALLVESNDPDQPSLRIPITTTQALADFVVNPERVNFGSVLGSDTQQVTATNLGTVPVQITAVYLQEGGSPDFAITENAEEAPALAQGEAIAYGVTYTPAGQDADEGTLLIEWSVEGAPQPVIEVPLRGNEPSPEIEVEPGSIVFGALELDEQSEVKDLVILNEGDADLIIDSITLAAAPPPTNDQYTLHDLPGDLPATVAPGENLRIGVSYHPTEIGVHTTAVAIVSNDVDERILAVPISGRVRRPCISVQPESVELGVVALSVNSARVPVQIVNCGDLDLELNDIRIEGVEGFQWEGVDGDPTGSTIVPRGLAAVRVWFTNNGLEEGEVATASLFIDNTTPDTPTVEVPLRVIGGGAPTCQISLQSADGRGSIGFGLVSRGSNRTRGVQVVNRGTGECQYRSSRIDEVIIPLPGFGGPKFFVTQEPMRLLPPTSFNPMEVTYRPDVFGAHQGTLFVTYFDPYEMEEREASIPVTGIGGESNIEVIPGHLDFGAVTAGECASREERVTVYNTGLVDLCISDISLEGACNEFFIVDRPIADADGCISVSRNTPADVILQYEPANLGEDVCELVFDSDADDSPELRVPLSGEGVADASTTDVFIQTSGQTVDILFIVDNSGSMQEEQRNLGNNFGTFIQGADQFQNDFQIGVVTTDMDDDAHSGKLRGNPRIIRRGPQAEAQFADNVDVGTNGSGDERGLAAAHAALSNPLAFDTGVPCNGDGDCQAPDTCVEGFCGGFNRGFLREGAALELIFVSDERDKSDAPVNFYVDFLKSIKGFRNENLMHAHVIAGTRNGQAESCSSQNGDADRAPRYVDVGHRTNGQVLSICEDNFGQNLRQIGDQAFGLPVQFFLSRPADPNTVQVTVDGRRVPPGDYEYDAESNSIIFNDDAVPEAGSRIEVSYEAQCFPRR